jgi:uncharacterized protein YbbC (DUF1343 family)
MKNFLLTFLAIQINLVCLSYAGCSINNKNIASKESLETPVKNEILTGAQQTEKYLPILKGKRIGLVVNQTAQINGVLLVDTLQKLNVNIKAIFGPEHGFRGTADAGEKVGNYIDTKTGIPVISLYGAKQQPSKEDLKDIDLLIFDIQDVGVRFYTYTITMARVMQACADSKVPMLILDRPNPNGNMVDGPILDMKFKSGVGMHQVPIAHGLTSAEFALMVNGEGWLKEKAKCDLQIIKNANYKHYYAYELPVKPSPNLPNALSIYLYPSLCLFEGTVVSQGRGTLFPFQVIGHPALKSNYSFSFTPKSIDGMSKNPPLENQLCYGIDFRNSEIKTLENQTQLDIALWLKIYQSFPDKANYFNAFFNKLAGNDILMQQIKDGKSEKEIRASWANGLTDYKAKRKKYLLYN